MAEIQKMGLSAKYKNRSSEMFKIYFWFTIYHKLDEIENAYFVFDLISCDISNNSELQKFATYLMDNYAMS